ncbi:MAG TPA: DNA replication/repair protein RecF [Luteimonas sp.]|jgi:DNA replication and repair protein RecF|nr:DNA replication/repair protein RecF [Luteimonas sp.]
MRVTRLDIANLRRFERVSLAPAPGLNLIVGANGAGKTSVLEALHLMAYGRSFRGRVHEGLVRSGTPAVELFVEWRDGATDAPGGASLHRAGLRHSGQSWEGRLDGNAVGHLGELCAALAVVTAEPGSHALITGGAELRRRFLDWGLFHVEPEFLPLWRRYARALKQRNALLKRGQRDPQLDAWELELAAAGEPLTVHRQHYLAQLQAPLQGVLAELLPAAGASQLDFVAGWRREETGLADALLLSRDRDFAAGHTTVGPHRADWRVDHADIPGRTGLSRGQAKLTALSVLLAQAGCHARLRGDWPILALDDLASELDRPHQRRVLEWVLASGAQLFITGTEPPAALAELGVAAHTFHVEQGRLAPEGAS